MIKAYKIYQSQKTLELESAHELGYAEFFKSETGVKQLVMIYEFIIEFEQLPMKAAGDILYAYGKQAVICITVGCTDVSAKASASFQGIAAEVEVKNKNAIVKVSALGISDSVVKKLPGSQAVEKLSPDNFHELMTELAAAKEKMLNEIENGNFEPTNTYRNIGFVVDNNESLLEAKSVYHAMKMLSKSMTLTLAMARRPDDTIPHFIRLTYEDQWPKCSMNVAPPLRVRRKAKRWLNSIETLLE